MSKMAQFEYYIMEKTSIILLIQKTGIYHVSILYLF